MHLAFYIVYILKVIACFSYSLPSVGCLGVSGLLWQGSGDELCPSFQPTNSNIHCLFATDYNIKVPETYLLPCFFCMLGFLSASMNHRPSCCIRAHIKFFNYRLSNLGSLISSS